MVEFYRDSPEYAGRLKKYHWYYPLFDGVEDQDTRVFYSGSNGYGEFQESYDAPSTPIPKSEFVSEYYLDGELVLSFNKAELTLSGDTFGDIIFDNLNDPDNVRLAFDDASFMGLVTIPLDENGVPITDGIPSYHSVKFMIDELPSDHFAWTVRFFDKNSNIVRSGSGTVDVVPAPWD